MSQRHAMIGDTCTNCGVHRRYVLDVPCMPDNKINVTTRLGGTTDADIEDRERDNIKHGEG